MIVKRSIDSMTSLKGGEKKLLVSLIKKKTQKKIGKKNLSKKKHDFIYKFAVRYYLFIFFCCMECEGSEKERKNGEQAYLFISLDW